MYKAYVLIENFHSSQLELSFSDFRLWSLRQGDFDELARLRAIFPGMPSTFTNWVYERSYPDDLTRDAFGYGRIPFDVEDTLLLLRLFKAGDITFSQQMIQNPNGTVARLTPYRVMASYTSSTDYRFDQCEIGEWDAFASKLPTYAAWQAPWFTVARKFFLYGGAKELNINFDEVDRIVDFMIALEATLVPESDFVGRRLRERAPLLLDQTGEEATAVKKLLRDFYEIRSTIVHGSELSERHRRTLARRHEFESTVRQLLVAAIQQLPRTETERKEMLVQLYDVPDDVRSEKVFQDFYAISSDDVRRQLLRRIANP